MSPSGLQVNKPFVLLIVGFLVVVILWFKMSSPKAAADVKAVSGGQEKQSLNTISDSVKKDLDKVEVELINKHKFKVNDKKVTVAYREKKANNAKLDILLLHGMKFKSQTWVDPPLFTMQLLYRLGYRVVAVDLPGFGNSPNADVDKAAFLKAFIDSVGLDKPVIVSPSMSGSFALPFLFEDPATVSSRTRGYIPVAPVYTPKYKNKYASVKIPVLVVYGSEDKGLGEESRSNLMQIPGAQEVKLMGAGHACYLNKPDEFHEHVYQFLQSLSS